jgi:hypothetical protein
MDLMKLEGVFKTGKINKDEGKMIEIVTPVFRASFPRLDEPQQFQGQGAYRYQISMLFNTGNPAEPAHVDMNAVILRALQKCATSNGLHLKAPGVNPFDSGEKLNQEGEPLAGYDEWTHWATASKYPKKPEHIVPVYDARGNATTPDTIYGGCYARALVQFYKPKKWKRVSIGLGYVQFVEDGESFGGGDMSFDAPDAIPGADAVSDVGDVTEF